MSHSRLDFLLDAGMKTWPAMPKHSEPQTKTDRINECLTTLDGEIDAFAVDMVISKPLHMFLPALDGDLVAVTVVRAETGRPFWVTACLDGVQSKSPPELADTIEEILKGRANQPS